MKVTDVGTSKAAVDITGTLAGSPANIAPEVIKSRVHNSKTDIYSLGILLWEIWYGEQAFAGTELALDAFFKIVDDGGRPKPLECCLKPDSRWEELMEKCWNEDPEKRPSAEECLKSISNKSKFVSGLSECFWNRLIKQKACLFCLLTLDEKTDSPMFAKGANMW